MILQVLNKLTAAPTKNYYKLTTVDKLLFITVFSIFNFQFSLKVIKWLINKLKHSQTLGTFPNFRSAICNLPFIFLCFFYTIWYLSKLHSLCSKFNLCSIVIIIKEKHCTIVIKEKQWVSFNSKTHIIKKEKIIIRKLASEHSRAQRLCYFF